MTETFIANKWIKPQESVVYKFFDRVNELYAKIDANIEENNNLIKQCDELLPLLTNGQVSLNSDLAVIAIIDKFTSFTLSSGSKSRRKSISPKRIWRTGLSVL